VRPVRRDRRLSPPEFSGTLAFFHQTGTREMGERRVIECHYPDFERDLRTATNQKHKIEPTNKAAWEAFVAKHDVPEPALKTKANAATMSGRTEAVIIEGAGSIDGYYRFSRDERYAMKFESGID
jgi:hypothetical protein